MVKAIGSKLRITIILLPVFLYGCGTVSTIGAWRGSAQVPQKRSEVIVESAPARLDAQPFINQFAMMAVFSKLVYRKDIAEPESRSLTATGCEYRNLTPSAANFYAELDKAGWYPVAHADEKAQTCLAIDGLFYQTYLHRTAAGCDEAVIAIRGTENDTISEKLSDWGSNLSAVFGIEPSEYKLARIKILPVIDYLKATYPGVKIYVTGHSLGGGIAQQLSFLSKDILAAYVFDPSPVTNWTNLKKHDLGLDCDCNKYIKVEDPLIYRIYHSNEALAYVRNVTTRFNTRRFGRSDYEFHFQKGGAVSSHEMGVLACHLSAQVTPTADHYYPPALAKAFIKNAGAEGDFCCPSGVNLKK